MTIDLKQTTAKSFGIKLQNGVGENLLIQFDKEDGKMFVDRTNAGKDKFSDAFYKNVHAAPIDFTKAELDI